MRRSRVIQRLQDTTRFIHELTADVVAAPDLYSIKPAIPSWMKDCITLYCLAKEPLSVDGC